MEVANSCFRHYSWVFSGTDYYFSESRTAILFESSFHYFLFFILKIPKHFNVPLRRWIFWTKSSISWSESFAWDKVVDSISFLTFVNSMPWQRWEFCLWESSHSTLRANSKIVIRVSTFRVFFLFSCNFSVKVFMRLRIFLRQE